MSDPASDRISRPGHISHMDRPNLFLLYMSINNGLEVCCTQHFSTHFQGQGHKIDSNLVRICSSQKLSSVRIDQNLYNFIYD